MKNAAVKLYIIQDCSPARMALRRLLPGFVVNGNVDKSVSKLVDRLHARLTDGRAPGADTLPGKVKAKANSFIWLSMLHLKV